MTDYTIRVLGFEHIPQTDQFNRINSVTRVRIMVGNYGPFTKDFAKGEDGVDAIQAWKQQMVSQVQSITS